MPGEGTDLGGGRRPFACAGQNTYGEWLRKSSQKEGQFGGANSRGMGRKIHLCGSGGSTPRKEHGVDFLKGGGKNVSAKGLRWGGLFI